MKLISSSSQLLPAPLPCQQSRSTVSAQEFQSELTRPDVYRPDSYLLMTHAVNPGQAAALRRDLMSSGKYQPQRDVDLLSRPQDITRKGVISASLIDPQHPATFGRALFFLGVPFPGVLATFPEDAYTTDRQQEFLESPPGATLAPTEILAQQKPGIHNEVVLRAQDVRIEGVGVKVMQLPDGKLDRPAETNRMRQIARELDVPFLEIMEKATHPDTPVQLFRDPGSNLVSAQLGRNGRKYIFSPNFSRKFFQAKAKDVEAIPQDEYQHLKPELQAALSDSWKDRQFFATIDAEFTR